MIHEVSFLALEQMASARRRQFKKFAEVSNSQGWPPPNPPPEREGYKSSPPGEIRGGS